MGSGRWAAWLRVGHLGPARALLAAVPRPPVSLTNRDDPQTSPGEQSSRNAASRREQRKKHVELRSGAPAASGSARSGERAWGPHPEGRGHPVVVSSFPPGPQKRGQHSAHAWASGIGLVGRAHGAPAGPLHQTVTAAAVAYHERSFWDLVMCCPHHQPLLMAPAERFSCISSFNSIL